MPVRKIIRIVKPVTLSRGLAIAQKMAYSDGTARWYRQPVLELIKLYGDIPVTRLTEDMVLAWSDGLEQARTRGGKPLKERTKNNRRRALRAVINKLVDAGHIEPPGPCHRWKISEPPKSPPRHLKQDDVARLRKAARADVRDHALVEMLYATGCRISELASMTVSSLVVEELPPDLTPEEEELLRLAEAMGAAHLLSSKAKARYRGKVMVIGKGQNGKKSPRWVFFGNTAAQALMAYLDTRPAKAPDNIFLTFKGTALSPAAARYVFSVVADRAGVKATPHTLRHTLAFRLIRNGADPTLVKQLLGHSHVTTTLEMYHGYDEAELWEAYEAFSDRENGNK